MRPISIVALAILGRGPKRIPSSSLSLRIPVTTTGTARSRSRRTVATKRNLHNNNNHDDNDHDDNVIIRLIPPSQTWPIRHRVMWPSKPFDFVKVEGDEVNDGTVQHYGLFLLSGEDNDNDDNEDQSKRTGTIIKNSSNKDPVSVVSVFLTPLETDHSPEFPMDNSANDHQETTKGTVVWQAQFRKFCTDLDHQGKGYGTRLLSYVFQSLGDNQSTTKQNSILIKNSV